MIGEFLIHVDFYHVTVMIKSCSIYKKHNKYSVYYVSRCFLLTLPPSGWNRAPVGHPNVTGCIVMIAKMTWTHAEC